MTFAIVAKELGVKKEARQILNDVTLNVPRGMVTGLIGPSGSGKTTLMRAVVGVQTYTGSLRIFDSCAGAKLLRARIGYVTQSPAIYDDLTVLQNLQYFATITRSSSSEVEHILESVHLVDKKRQLVATLSGGQRARVSLAVALLGDPDLLVLDEPTVGLDPVLREDLWNLFQELADHGKTLLISSHVMDEADRCDNLILLRDGNVLWNNTRQKLLESTHASGVGAAFLAMIKGAQK